MRSFQLGSKRRYGAAAQVACLVLALQAGCSTPAGTQPSGALPQAATEVGLQTLSAGDVIRISFPGAPNLETTQQIRRDGRINLTMIGEVVAADKTPAQLEAELVQQYSSQLVSKEIKVTVVSSSFAVFVTGAVLRPGKIAPDRAVTALEAIMEAGGFDSTKANAAAVRVIRHEGGQTRSFTIDLRAVLEGRSSEAFYLKSHDIVFVPDRFAWF